MIYIVNNQPLSQYSQFTINESNCLVKLTFNQEFYQMN